MQNSGSDDMKGNIESGQGTICGTVQYSTAQCSAVQYNTVQMSKGSGMVIHGTSNNMMCTVYCDVKQIVRIKNISTDNNSCRDRHDNLTVLRPGVNFDGIRDSVPN